MRVASERLRRKPGSERTVRGRFRLRFGAPRSSDGRSASELFVVSFGVSISKTGIGHQAGRIIRSPVVAGGHRRNGSFEIVARYRPVMFRTRTSGRAQAHGPVRWPPLLFFAIINSHGHIVPADRAGGDARVCLVTVEGRHIRLRRAVVVAGG